MKEKNKNLFLEKAQKIHDNFYDYSSVVYKNARTKVDITCPAHGVFSQYPHHHTQGRGCTECGKLKNSSKQSLSKERFVEKANLIHDDLYDYSMSKYKNYKTPVEIICQHHGAFAQTPSNHLSGAGCTICGNDRIKLTLEDFKIKSKSIHFDKYDYSLVEYNNSKTSVVIICPIHGKFHQTPHDHLSGRGCNKCAIVERADGLKKSKGDFILESCLVHENKYDYSYVEYVNSKTKVKIICPIHGEFEQAPTHHTKGVGCPYCNESKGERKISKLLKENLIKFVRQKKFEGCKNVLQLPFDFYLPEYNICIEYDGRQHFEPVDYFGGEKALELTKINDGIKSDYCSNNGVKLYRIAYNENLVYRMQQLIVSL